MTSSSPEHSKSIEDATQNLTIATDTKSSKRPPYYRSSVDTPLERRVSGVSLMYGFRKSPKETTPSVSGGLDPHHGNAPSEVHEGIQKLEDEDNSPSPSPSFYVFPHFESDAGTVTFGHSVQYAPEISSKDKVVKKLISSLAHVREAAKYDWEEEDVDVTQSSFHGRTLDRIETDLPNSGIRVMSENLVDQVSESVPDWKVLNQKRLSTRGVPAFVTVVKVSSDED